MRYGAVPVRSVTKIRYNNISIIIGAAGATYRTTPSLWYTMDDMIGASHDTTHIIGGQDQASWSSYNDL